MKRHLLLLLMTLFTCLYGYAQEEMKEDFVNEIDHSFDLTQKVGDEYCYASSSKEITVFELPSGKMKWNKKYAELSKDLSKVDDIISMSGSGAIFVFDRKLGKDKMACIDANTGELLWLSAKYQDVEDADNIFYIEEMEAFAITTKANLTMVKARTGEELWTTTKFKGVVGDYVITDDALVLINMKPSLIGSIFAGLKNQIVKVNKKNGDVLWDQTYRGVVEKKILTREMLVNLRIEEGKVFLYLNGIQVFDLADGKPLWSAVYDMTPSDVVKNKRPMGAVRFGAYGVVAKPIIVGDYVYVLDMENKKNQFLKKYEIKTGKMIWRSAEIKDARAIPGIYVVGDRVILQVGGQVELQYIVRTRNPDGSYSVERTIEFENIKPMNVQCFNAISGEQLWESEKMKKGLTNLFAWGNNAIICSGKALYSLDIDTGKENYEIELKDDNIGLADLILDDNNNTVIIGEKGISLRQTSDGSLTGSSKFKKSVPLSYNGKYIYGDRMALYTKGSDFAVYDLKTVKYKRFDARKGASAYLSSDGIYLYVFESGGMLRKSKFTRLSAK